MSPEPEPTTTEPVGADRVRSPLALATMVGSVSPAPEEKKVIPPLMDSLTPRDNCAVETSKNRAEVAWAFPPRAKSEEVSVRYVRLGLPPVSVKSDPPPPQLAAATRRGG